MGDVSRGACDVMNPWCKTTLVLRKCVRLGSGWL